jgi:hypothetical protein
MSLWLYTLVLPPQNERQDHVGHDNDGDSAQHMIRCREQAEPMVPDTKESECLATVYLLCKCWS